MTNNDHNLSSKAYSEVESEAIAWLTQLDGENISEKDLRAFREWVNRSPAHLKQITKLNEFWGALNILPDLVGPIYEADKTLRRMRKREKWSRIGKLSLGGLAAVAVIGIFAVQNLQPVSRDQDSIAVASVYKPALYVTDVGETRTHTLSDGSVVTLNTNSKIEVEFHEDQRRVRLFKGEAAFDIAHESKRPFFVQAGNGLVRAIGTAFTVRLENDSIEVVISEGSVEISEVEPIPLTQTKKSAEVSAISTYGILKAGHKAKIEGDQYSTASLSSDKMASKLSWKSGYLSFSGEPLEQVIREVGRYTNDLIIIDDPALKNLKLGGVFKLGDTQDLYITLESGFGISVDDSREGVVRLSSKL